MEGQQLHTFTNYRPIIYYIAHCGARNQASPGWHWFKRARQSQSRCAIYHSPGIFSLQALLIRDQWEFQL
jgi:hypothetical protein